MRLVLALLLAPGFSAGADLILRIEDYATAPLTGAIGESGNRAMPNRINFFRPETGGAGRIFINDLNGPLYIFDKKTKEFTTYLDFNGRGKPGLFPKFTYEQGFANGLVSFQFDPDYARNGRFYTIHIEDPRIPGGAAPDAAKLPGYTVTQPAITPGQIQREAVLIEWTDTNISNVTFEGSARELLRVQYNGAIHPMGDLSFNPSARRGGPEWRVLYVSSGDGGSGEQKNDTRMNPQRLDTLVGKILRIIPDLKERTASSSISENGQFRIPNDNPFVSMEGARKEIWALGLRNPHRLTWEDGHLIANNIGLAAWETIVLVHKGANYGYSLREGNQQLNPDNTMSDLPESDRIPVQINGSTTRGTVVPSYPAAQYGHVQDGGDAVAGGFVYHGKIRELRGKYLFGDISTGRIWWIDPKELLAADDGNPRTMAAMHEVKFAWNDPNDLPDAGRQIYPSMYPITEAGYHTRSGKDSGLPGRKARISGGRADIRLALDGDGELYILSKSDGMIRAVVGAETR